MIKPSRLILSLLLAATIFASVLFTGCDNPNSSSDATEITTITPTTAQPTTAASTDDTANKQPTWNYSKLKLNSNAISNDFDNIITKNKFRGTVYVKIGNDFEYIGTNGFSDKDEHINNSLNTCYRIASITKQFTAVAIMQLKEQGKLSVDDTIDKYYPSYKYGKKITVKNLLTMTSGISDYFNIDGASDADYYAGSVETLPYKIKKNNSAKENKKIIMDWIFKQQLSFEPDTDYMYSNSSYYLLGDIIEKVSGVSYEDFITENLLKPAGMKSTGFTANEKLAKGYQDIFNSEWNLYPGVAYSAGGLISNVPDLLKWIDALCSNSLISKESFDEMTTEYKDNYGYGFMLNDNYVYHTGKIDRYNSIIMFSKNQNLINIALSNYTQSDIKNLSNELSNKLAPYYG